MNKFLRYLCLFTLTCLLFYNFATANDQIPVAAPMTTDLAGSSGATAVKSVFRVICPPVNRSGTGFLHKSGNIITCAHVVEGCPVDKIIVLRIQGQKIQITKVVSDQTLDLAVLHPTEPVHAPTLTISTRIQFSIGSQVSTWGFPVGYKGMVPLLSSGYLSGIDNVMSSNGKIVQRLVINAAFNSGNSGGPLVEIENNTIIGVVASKIAPLPPYIESALNALKSHRSGFTFTKTKTDGTKETVSEAQVVEEVLQYLRRQIQLVIGHAVQVEDLRNFLKSNGIEP